MPTTPSSTSAAGTPVRPAERYGDRPPGQRPWPSRVVIGALALLALGGWIWIAYLRADPDVQASLLSFDHITDTSVEVRWQVARDPAATAVCFVRAVDERGTEVGRARVEVAPGEPREQVVTHRVATLTRPFNAQVLGCRLAR
jgi:hypothetical protein